MNEIYVTAEADFVVILLWSGKKNFAASSCAMPFFLDTIIFIINKNV